MVFKLKISGSETYYLCKKHNTTYPFKPNCNNSHYLAFHGAKKHQSCPVGSSSVFSPKNE